MNEIKMSIEPMGLYFLDEDDMLKFIGQVAGECYNSDMTDDKCVTRALNCIKRGHHSPWEHINLTLKFTVDRGVSHALVRHRHCGFQQGSTIYQKYNCITTVENELDNDEITKIKKEAYKAAELAYLMLISKGVAPSEARDVLPTNLATGLIITTNMREWQYMMRRRTGPGDSHKMHKWADMTYDWFLSHYPKTTVTFDQWYGKHPL